MGRLGKELSRAVRGGFSLSAAPGMGSQGPGKGAALPQISSLGSLVMAVAGGAAHKGEVERARCVFLSSSFALGSALKQPN